MPELFKCDLSEFYETCEIYADTKDLNSLLVVSDEAESYNLFKYYFTEIEAVLRTEGYLLKEDASMKTFWNFVLGRDYLNSNWTDQLHQDNRLHVRVRVVACVLQIGDQLRDVFRLPSICALE